jgi:thioredoxin 1
MSKAAAVTAADFDKEVLQSDVPVLVDFWAVWCGPCRMIGPSVDAVAEEFEGKAKVFKVDTDTEGDLAMKYNIMSIPALLFFKNGQVADQLVGAVPKSEIANRLNKLVAN